MTGTEIGGGFLSGTLLQPQAPSTFSTPTVGTQLALLAPDGRQSLHGRWDLQRGVSTGEACTQASNHAVYLSRSAVI